MSIKIQTQLMPVMLKIVENQNAQSHVQPRISQSKVFMKDKKNREKHTKSHEKSHAKNLARTSYYTQGGFWNPQTEVGIQGAYGSQGERDRDNSYTES